MALPQLIVTCAKCDETIFESVEFTLFTLLFPQVAEFMRRDVELFRHKHQEPVLSFSAQTFPMPGTRISLVLVVSRSLRFK